MNSLLYSSLSPVSSEKGRSTLLQRRERAGDRRIRSHVVRDTRVPSKVVPSPLDWGSRDRLLPASHDHLGDHHTYRVVKDVKPLKAVAAMKVNSLLYNSLSSSQQ